MFKDRRAYIKAMIMKELEREGMKEKEKMKLELQETIISKEPLRSVSPLIWGQRRRRGRVKDVAGGGQERTLSILCPGSKDARPTALNNVQRLCQRTSRRLLCGPKLDLGPVSNILLHHLVIPIPSHLPKPRRPSLVESLLLFPDPLPPLLAARRTNPGLSNHRWLLITHQNNRGSLLRRGRDGQKKPSR